MIDEMIVVVGQASNLTLGDGPEPYESRTNMGWWSND